LLELGVPLWKPWGIADRDHWTALGGGRWRYRCPGSGWSRLVPGLRDGRRLRLAPAPVPQLARAWAGRLPLAPRTELWGRDPRDARRLRRAPAPAPQFTPAWPGRLRRAPRLVLWVRDPRDALCSAWQRAQRSAPAQASPLSHFASAALPGLPLSRAQYLGWFL